MNLFGAMPNMMGNDNLTVGSVSQTMNNSLQPEEEALMTAMNNMGPNPSPLAMMNMQAQLSNWSNLLMADSSITKLIGDTTKSITQNIGS